MSHSTLNHWIACEAIPFEPKSRANTDSAVDQVMAIIDSSLELLGFGEPMHGGDEFLTLRNQLFQRLVERHGFSAIAVESSFPRGRSVERFVAGQGESYEAIRDAGFSHQFGRLQANRELVEWMRSHNADVSPERQIHFYGFDSPTEYGPTDSPRQLLTFAIDYLAKIDLAAINERRQRIELLLGNDADWENPAAVMDPTKSIGLSPNATSLRIEVEDLIAEMQIRRPELIAASDRERYLGARHDANCARQLLNYHAALARSSNNRIAQCLALRDAMMADNLTYIADRERARGRVFVFAHNSHLKLGKAEWQLGADLLQWWPAGAHARSIFGSRYQVIGCGLGTSEKNGVGQPEAGTLETRLIASSGPARFIPTHNGEGLPAAEIAALPMRSGSTKNFSYFPLTAQSLSEFDWLAVLNSIE